MPHIDARSGEVIIRIVYDGAPEAGKTTNVQQLLGQIALHRRGAAESPGTSGARTEFFDWLDFSGGYLDGRRVRCQLVSVPGQSQLLHRRKYLLESADAIVFVSDSRPAAFAESSRNFATTARLARRVEQGVPLGMVLQANKQDLPDAVSAPEVARALGMDPATAVVSSVAHRGDGVMQTFVLAVRLATDRVRTLLLDRPLSELPGGGENPEALHAAMLELEEERAALPGLEHVVLRSEVAEAMLLAAEVPAASEVPEVPAPAPEKSPTLRPPSLTGALRSLLRRHNALTQSDLIPLPQASEIASGHVWPPVKGRAAVALATSSKVQTPARVRPWAPADACELASDAGWTLHTTARWVFASESLARHRLLTLVRGLLSRSEMLPEGRALAVARDQEQWRIWLLTPAVPSLAEELLLAIETCNPAAITSSVEHAVLAVRELRGLGFGESAVRAGSAGLGLVDGRPVLLTLDEGDDSGTPRSQEPLAELASLLLESANGEQTLNASVSDALATIARAQTERREHS